MTTTIWLRSYPLLCDLPITEPPTPTWLKCCLNDADKTVNFGDDNSGDVVSVQPNGDIQHRPHGTVGIWEQSAVASDANLIDYKGTGVHYRVPYRAR